MEVKLENPENAQFCLYNAKKERVYSRKVEKYYLLPETDSY